VRTAGIDIGSRTVKLAVLEDGRLALSRVEYNTHDPLEVCRRLLEGAAWDALAATGYGRHLFAASRGCPTVTEIQAAGLGARFFFPAARTVLDIGGQDTKAISLDPAGRVARFEMNDRCAAGTGRFLEVMAGALTFSMDDFIAAASAAARGRKVSAMCTVFAESEVVSQVARGAPRDELALGIHQSVAARATAMAKRIDPAPEIVFCGGVALNGCLRRLIADGLGMEVRVPPDPRIVAALGCALWAAENG
jgi:(R)-2-hydroxyacyl-CoA dehydratese activating ATPase